MNRLLLYKEGEGGRDADGPHGGPYDAPVADHPKALGLRAVILGVLWIAVAGGSALAQTGGGYDLTWNSIDCGGETFSTGGGYTVGGTAGQGDASDVLSGGGYFVTGGFWAAPAVALCADSAACDDGDPGTCDMCRPSHPGAAADGCVNSADPPEFGDIAAPFCPPTCPAPLLDDVLYVLDAFRAGPNWNTGFPLADLGSTSGPPCDQDGRIDLTDILHELSAFEGSPPCPDRCP